MLLICFDLHTTFHLFLSFSFTLSSFPISFFSFFILHSLFHSISAVAFSSYLASSLSILSLSLAAASVLFEQSLPLSLSLQPVSLFLTSLTLSPTLPFHFSFVFPCHSAFIPRLSYSLIIPLPNSLLLSLHVSLYSPLCLLLFLSSSISRLSFFSALLPPRSFESTSPISLFLTLFLSFLYFSFSSFSLHPFTLLSKPLRFYSSFPFPHLNLSLSLSPPYAIQSASFSLTHLSLSLSAFPFHLLSPSRSLLRLVASPSSSPLSPEDPS